MNTRNTALSLALVLLLAAVAPAAAATAPVESDAVGDLTVTTAPATTSATAAAEAGSQSDPTNSIVSANDVVVLRLDAAGVAAEADDDGTLLGDELELSLQQTESSVDTNESAKTLAATADTEGVAANATENAVYVAIDLEKTTFQQGNGSSVAAVGDSFTASATLTDAVTDGENYTRTATFGVVEPKVNFLDGVTEAPAGEVVNYEVATTLAPGTSLTFSLVSNAGGESSAETTTQVTVNDNGRATGQFSFFTFEANEEYTISITSEEAGLNKTWTGTAQATGTQTEEPTDTSTQTSTSAPGFGVVAALLALVGAGFVARRE